MAEPARALDVQPPAEVRFTLTPRNLTREQALAYLGWAPKLFDLMEKQGAITGRPHGRNGTKIYSRELLDEVDRKRSGAAANDDGGLDDAI